MSSDISLTIQKITGGHPFEDLVRHVIHLKEHRLYAIYFPSRSTVIFFNYKLISIGSARNITLLNPTDIALLNDIVAITDPNHDVMAFRLVGGYEIEVVVEDEETIIWSYPTDIAGLCSFICWDRCSSGYASEVLYRMLLAVQVLIVRIHRCNIPQIVMTMWEIMAKEIKETKCSAYSLAIPFIR